jgi:hypothetical protein
VRTRVRYSSNVNQDLRRGCESSRANGMIGPVSTFPMKLRTKVYLYATLVAVGVLTNLFLLLYRRHLYELNADYAREPLHQIQMFLFRGTEVLVLAGGIILLWSKLSDRS